MNEKINNSKLINKLFGNKPNDGDIQSSEGLWYSVCGFGQNLICTIVGSYLTVFMTDALGFGAIAVALLMLFTRVYDAANDPIMGSIVDRTRTKWGKCRPYLKWMAIPIAIMTILCFLPWYPANPGGFAAITIVYVIWSMVYTVADVPYWALATAMTNDTYRRGNMLTVARLLCTAGAGLVTVIVPIITSGLTAGTMGQTEALQSLLNELQTLSGWTDGTDLAAFIGAAGSTDLNALWEGAKGAGYALTDVASLKAAIASSVAATQADLRMIYFVAAIVCCVVALPLFFIGFKNTQERNLSTEKPPSLKHNLKLLFSNKPLMLIVLSGIGGAARMLFTYTGGLYFAKYVMGNEALYTVFTMAVVPGGLIASVLVPYFTRKVGKRNTYIWSHLLGGVAMLLAFLIGIIFDHGHYTSTWTFICLVIALVLAGIPQGFGNIITYAMIGDTVEYLELKSGERAEGICFAMQTLINKIGMAVGAFVGVLAYYLAGVEANNTKAMSEQSKDIMWTILMLVAAISFFLTVIPLFFYHFNEKEQQEAVAEIKRRKEAAQGGAEVATESASVSPSEQE